MNTHSLKCAGFFQPAYCQVVKSQNELDINRVNSFNNRKNNTLVFLMESGISDDMETNATIRGNNLVLEALRVIDLGKPVRMHLLEDESITENDIALTKIGFSEFILRRGFRYQIQSCEVLKPGLIKVNLTYSPKKTNNKNQLLN